MLVLDRVGLIQDDSIKLPLHQPAELFVELLRPVLIVQLHAGNPFQFLLGRVRFCDLLVGCDTNSRISLSALRNGESVQDLHDLAVIP